LDVEQHKNECQKFNTALADKFSLPGISAQDHTYWVYPVISAELKTKIAFFRDHNFFLSSQHGIRLYDQDNGELSQAKTMLDNIVYLPIYKEMPDKDKSRLINLLKTL
jgi:dTDP-4-amino-4,6-dideoxygalactose transaminase